MADELEVRHLDGLRADTDRPAAPRSSSATRSGPACPPRISAASRGHHARGAPPRPRGRQPDLVALAQPRHRPRRSGGVSREDAARRGRTRRGSASRSTCPSASAAWSSPSPAAISPGASFAFRRPSTTVGRAHHARRRARSPTCAIRELSAGARSRRTRRRTSPPSAPWSATSRRKEPAMPDAAARRPVPDPVPPVPPVVTERSAPPTTPRCACSGATIRSGAGWRSARKHPKEYGAAAPRRRAAGDDHRAAERPRAARAVAKARTSAGGFTVPDILHGAAGSTGCATRSVVVRAGAVTVPLTSDVTKIARLLTDPTAAWRAENARGGRERSRASRR